MSDMRNEENENKKRAFLNQLYTSIYNNNNSIYNNPIMNLMGHI